MIVRRATAPDAAALAELIDGFAIGHPAQNHPRSIERLEEVFFGETPMAYALLAEDSGVAIGFGIWRKTYDVFWSMYGGEGIGLYVSPSRRRSGIAVAIIAAMCEEIRRQGGRFLQTSYDSDLAALYERVGIGRTERACHVSAEAFQKLANLAGESPREIVRALPDKALNFAAAR